jgi:LemA protein
MKNKTLLIVFGLVILLAGPAACNYNGFVNKEEEVKNAWSFVQSAYQRRADLIPNLVNTVKGAANFEQETLMKVIAQRAEALNKSAKIDPDKLTDENIQKFQAAQAEIGSGIGRLLAVVESYPTLTATKGFQDLQLQLEETENRIKAERDKFNEAVKQYNISVRRFPGNIFAGLFGFGQKPAFQAEAGSDKAPEVKF